LAKALAAASTYFLLLRGIKGVDKERGSAKDSSKLRTNDLGRSGFARQALVTFSSNEFEFNLLMPIISFCFLIN